MTNNDYDSKGCNHSLWIGVSGGTDPYGVASVQIVIQPYSVFRVKKNSVQDF